MAVAGTVISAQADTGDGWSVTAAVAQTPDGGVADSQTAAGLVSVAGLAAGDEVAAGSDLTYVLTITRAADAIGDDLATVNVVDDVTGLLSDAKVTGDLPSGVLFDGSNVTWTVPAMGKGQTATTYFQVSVNDDAAAGATLATGAGIGELACTEDSCATSLTVSGASDATTPATDDEGTTPPADDETTTPPADGESTTPADDETTDVPADSTASEPATQALAFTAADTDGTLLPGAVFEIIGASGATFCVADNSAKGDADACAGATPVADEAPADGEFFISGLPADSYTLLAVVAPLSHALPDKPTEFKLAELGAGVAPADPPADSEAPSTDTSAADTSAVDSTESTSTEGNPFRDPLTRALVRAGGATEPVVTLDAVVFPPVTIGAIQGQISAQSSDQSNACLKYYPNGSSNSVFQSGPTSWVSNPTEAIGSHGYPSNGNCSDVSNSYDSITSKASALGVVPSTVASVTPGQAFLLGAAIHHNNVIPGSGTNGQRVTGTLGIKLTNFGDATFSVPWQLWETPNQASPCANGAANNSGINGNGCADEVTFTSQIPSTTVTISGATYKLVFSGFRSTVSSVADCPATPTGAVINEFWTKEQATTVTCFYGVLQQVRQLTIKKVIEPATQTSPSFSFTDTSSLDGSPWKTGFNLTGGQSKKSDLLQGENVTVTEGTQPAGWTLKSLQCTYDDGSDLSADDAAAISTASGKLTITGIPGNATKPNITCTFTNATTSLTLVKKVTTPDGVTDVTSSSNVGQWTLTADPGSGATKITGDANSAAVTSQTVTAGKVYNLSETTVAGYTNGTTWQCVAADSSSVTSTSTSVTPKAGQQITCTITNKQKASSLKIKKLDATTNAPVGGATFQLWRDDNGTSGLQTTGANADTQIGSPVTTPTSPDYTSTASGLSFGTYYWVETHAPDGYVLPTGTAAYSAPQVINAAYANAGTTATLTVSDPQISTGLTVKKLDETTGAPLAGATFALYKGTPPASGNPPAADKVDQCDTGADGTCTINNLGFGSYYWYEVSAPNGYNLPANRYSAAITINADNAGKTIAATEFSDPRKTTSLTVKKVDDTTSAPLSGAGFELYQVSSGTSVPTSGDTTPGTLVKSCNTGADGTCSVSGLGFGTYYWFERSAPTGYTLPGNRFSVAITITAANAGTNFDPVVFRDPQNAATLKVKKVDKTTKAVLAGAKFQLWRETNSTAGLQMPGDTKVGSECTTTDDSTGSCTVPNLAFGTYYWVETQAPAGYVLPSNPVTPVVVDATNGGTTVTTTVDNSKLLPVTVTKTADSATQNTTTGVWTVKYTVTVTNPNAQDSVYTLTDDLGYPTNVTVQTATISGRTQANAAITTVAGWNGGYATANGGNSAHNTVVTGQAIPAGTHDTYSVTVTATVPASVSADLRTCSSHTSGLGFFNSTTVTSFGVPQSADACKNIPTAPQPTITKQVKAGSPTQNNDGTWTIQYNLVVTNPSGDYAVDYTLRDVFKFGDGITVASGPSVTTKPSSVTLKAGWNGGTQPVVAEGQTLAAGAVHTYVVSVTASVASAASTNARNCTLDGNETGTGFLNGATVSSGSYTSPEATACAQPVSPEIQKTFNGTNGQAAQHLGADGKWDGTWDAVYTVTVHNPSTTTGLIYSLSDTPGFPLAGVTINGSGTHVTGDHQTASTEWNGTTHTAVVGTVSLAAGATDTYTFTVNVTIDTAVASAASLQCNGTTPTAGEGLYNRATVTSGNDSSWADACGNVPQPGTPGITKTVKSVTQNSDGSWTIVYTLVVDNDSNGDYDSQYSLTDTLKFGGFSTVSATVVGTNGIIPESDWNGKDKTLVSSGVIPHGHHYDFEVTATATLNSNATTEQLDCVLATGENGTGFLNTAEVSSGSTTLKAQACATPVRPQITKTAGTPTRVLDTNGNWDGVSWAVPYTITVKNPSVAVGAIPATNLTYTLTDTPRYPGGVTATGGSVGTATSDDSSAPTVAGAGNKGTFAGGTLTIIDPARSLSAGKTDTFPITILATVPVNQDLATLACNGTTPQYGFDNEATVKSGSFELTAAACVGIPRFGKPTITKQVTSGPAQGTDGKWTTVYTVTVDNSGSTVDSLYSLSDTPDFGGDIDITSASATGPSGAISGWNGTSGHTTLASNATVAAAHSAVYTVTITANVAAGAYTGGTASCLADVKHSGGHGFFNSATLSVPGSADQTDSDCASPVKPTIEKHFVSAAQSGNPWNGTWDVTYTVTVKNPSTTTDLLYSLSDTPHFASGVTINSGSATVRYDGATTDVAAGTLNAAKTVIESMATNHKLVHRAAGTAQDVYTVTVNVSLTDALAASGVTCGNNPGEGDGLYNTATALSGGLPISDSDCGDIPGNGRPDFTKALDGQPVQDAATGNWTVKYTLTVDNSHNSYAAKYSLTDSLAGYASGIDVLSRTVKGPGAATASDWNGTDALATDRSIAAGATDTYTVTVVASVTDQTKAEDRACDATKGAGHGFFNSAMMTVNGTGTPGTACGSPATPEITKTFIGAAQHAGTPWDGTWDVTYTVTVHNTSTDTALRYSLSDTPNFLSDVTINNASATFGGVGVGTWAAGATANTGTLSGMAAGQALAANGTDTYTVTVNVTIPATVTGDALNCSTPKAPGHGLYNKATVTSGDDSYFAEDCGTIPEPPAADVAKTLRSVTQKADGTWDVIYDLVVTNTQPTLSAPYSLSDTLAYSSKITVNSASVTGPNASGTWTGRDAHTVVVAAGFIGPNSHLDYTVTVNATVGADATSTDTDCVVGNAADGHGFLNRARLVSGSHAPVDVSACGTPVLPVITKIAGTPVQNIDPVTGAWDGKWTIPYTISVNNPSGTTNLQYLLSDTPRFPDPVSVDAAEVTGSDDGHGAVVPGITGGVGALSGGTLSIITATSGPRNLAAGATDTFQISVTATVPVELDSAMLACQQGVAKHGFDNIGTVTSGQRSFTDEACKDIPEPAKPTITKALDGQPVQGTDGLWTIKYTLTVDNTAGKVAGNYTLTDKMDYGTGIDVKTSAVTPDPSGNWNGTTQQTIAADATIAAGATHTFNVTVTAEVTDKATVTSAACVDQTTPGHGFFNGATLTVGNTSSNSTVCAEPALPTVDKTFVSTADNAAGGWDVTYTVTVSNPSTDKALYYSLTDTPEFAAGIDVTGAEVTAADIAAGIPGTWDAATGTLTIIPAGSEVSLAAGAHHAYTIVVSTAKPSAPIDPAVVACTTPNPAPGHGFYNRADATSGGTTYSDDACSGVPAWTVAKQVDKQTAHVGDTLTYTLRATNTGSVDVSGAKGIDTLPANVTLDPVTLDPSLAVSGKTLTWAIPDMPAGSAAVTVEYKVTVDEAAAGTTQTNLVVPDGPGGSCEPSQGQDSNCKTDTDVPRWTLRKTSDPVTGSTVQPGSTIKYTLTVTNKGPKALSGASVIDDLSAVLNNAAFVAGSIVASGTGSASLTGTSLTWTLPDGIAVNDTATVSYSVTVNAGARGVTLTNVATPDPKDPAGICEPSTDPNAPANANCTTTHRTPPPVVIPNTATPAYSVDQCVLGDDGESGKLTVSTVATTGIAYTVTGNGTGAVTIVATAQGGYELNVPSGWTGDTSSASITVRASDAAICVGGESSTTPPPSTTTSAGANVKPSETIEVLPSHGDIAYTGVNTIGMSALALVLLVLGGGLLWLGMAGWRRPTQH